MGAPLGERARPNGLPLRVGYFAPPAFEPVYLTGWRGRKFPLGVCEGVRGSGRGAGGLDGRAHQGKKARGKGGE